MHNGLEILMVRPLSEDISILSYQMKNVARQSQK